MSLLMRGPSANELVERRVSGPARWSVAAVALTPELEDMKIDAVHQYRTETAVFGGERAIEAMIRRSHHRRGGELIWHRHPTVARTARIVTARIRLLVVAMFVAVTIGAPLAHAAPRSAGIARVEAVTDRWMRVFVDSPAMGREVQVDMLLPADRAAPHPMVYLLEGGDSLRPGENDWTAQGGAVGFFADKDVTGRRRRKLLHRLAQRRPGLRTPEMGNTAHPRTTTTAG
jgi:hypothetical protein